MCGIAGIIHSSASRPLIEAMTEVMISRGPDGAGYHVEPGVAMGMRRLSIIDLAHGWQPLYSGERSVVAFQNGEIYNFQELRKQLQAKGYVFQTDSDTEVLAHGYHAWGIEDLANRLDGMYANERSSLYVIGLVKSPSLSRNSRAASLMLLTCAFWLPCLRSAQKFRWMG
jgi:asparagine synthase (glutamine-hydrolysing)